MEWSDICRELEVKFDCEIGVNEVLMLVGMREMGFPFRPFSRDEKLNLVTLGCCLLYRELGWVKRVGVDSDGWPTFEENRKVVTLSESQKIEALKRGAIIYFTPLMNS